MAVLWSVILFTRPILLLNVIFSTGILNIQPLIHGVQIGSAGDYG